jgi:predicted site-specific integrase-resolvase
VEDSTSKDKNLQPLLERVISGSVETIVVAHKDRLAQLGFDWLDWFCGKFEQNVERSPYLERSLGRVSETSK